MSKKVSGNGFYFFMLDYQTKHGKSKFPSLKMVSEIVGPIWSRMSAKEREPYNQRAKNARGSGEKYTSQGKSFTEVERLEKERLDKVQSMKDMVHKIVRQAIRSDRLPQHTFYIMHMNYYCRHSETKVFYPAEVGICKFTLNNGVDRDVFHALIQPGELPMGYSFEAKNFSQNTHQLPVQFRGAEEDNREEVFMGILKYLEQPDGSYPTLFVLDARMECVEDVLDKFSFHYYRDEICFKICSLQFLLYVLQNNVSGTSWPSLSISEQQFETDVHAYTQDIACEFHQNTDVVFHCSRSYAVRSAYIICDNCCQHLGIKMVPGRHVPSNARVTNPDEFDDVCSSRSISTNSVEADTDECINNLDNFSITGFSTESEVETETASGISTFDKPLNFIESETSDSNDDWIPSRSSHRKKKSQASLSTQGSSHVSYYGLAQTLPSQQEGYDSYFESNSSQDTVISSRSSVTSRFRGATTASRFRGRGQSSRSKN